MPPERLRWSRTLRRPLISHAEPYDNSIGPVMISEVLEHEDARVGGNCTHRNNILFICRPVRKLQPRHRSPDCFWGVYLYSDDDREFNASWEVTHGHRWPFIAGGGVHPALRRLYRKYQQFEREWSRHADESEMGFYDDLYQQQVDAIDMILMEAEERDLMSVIDRFPVPFL